MRQKQVLHIVICMLLSVCIALGLTACSGTTEQLNAPQITLTGNVISWKAIEHADSYEIYEADTHIATQSGTSYTINKTVEGTYTFTVKATSADAKYNTSNNSNAVNYTYTVTNTETEQLSAPSITLTDNIISWAAVENAVLYEIYENNSLVTRQIETTYTIRQVNPGTYGYTVKAVSGDEHYTTSNASNVVTYIVNDNSDAPVQLAAPQIAIDEQTGVVSWNAVEHATGYIVFENNDAVSTQTETAYTITQTLVGTYSYSVIATSLNAAYTTSPRSNVKTYTVKPTQLTAPVVTREGRLLSWKAVENADEYEVYENSRRVSIQTETSYSITQTRFGTYNYTVIAKSSSSQYVSSNASEPVEFVLVDNAPLLDAPVITINNETGVISWNAVEHADGYRIYENGLLVFSTEELSYSITRLNPGTYTYTVSAICDSNDYRASEQSNAVEYTVKAVEMEFTVNVAFPQGYPSQSVTIGLYDGDRLVISEVVTLDSSTLSGEVKIKTMSGKYAVKVISQIPNGYVATQSSVSAELAVTSLNIIKLGNNVLNVGVNKVGGAEYTEQDFIFIATKGGVYSIIRNETAPLEIFVGGSLVVGANEIGTFKAEAGEALKVTVYFGATGTFSFEIVEGEVPQYLNVGTGNVTRDKANYILNGVTDCTRYLTVEETTTFAFFFTTATINLRLVTITINGQSYVFDGDENCLQEITIDAGVDIEIKFHIDGVDEIEGMHIAFFVYKVD